MTEALPKRSALVCGASIAGPAAAYRLHRHGFDVTVVEKADTVRGGYPIGIRGTAAEAVRRMGLLPRFSPDASAGTTTVGRPERVPFSLAGAANTVPDRLRAPARSCRTPSPRPSLGGPTPPGPAAAPHARLCAGHRAQQRRSGTTARPAGRGRARCRS